MAGRGGHRIGTSARREGPREVTCWEGAHSGGPAVSDGTRAAPRWLATGLGPRPGGPVAGRAMDLGQRTIGDTVAIGLGAEAGGVLEGVKSWGGGD